MPNNVALRLLVKILGPMPGAFRGPYPSRDEAFAALRTPDGRINRGGARTAETLGFPASADLGWVAEDLAEFRRLRFARYKDATIILGNLQCAVLADRVTGVKYARYFRDQHGPLSQTTFGQVIAHLNEEIRLDPTEPDLYWERAETLFGQKQWDRAYADYARALEVAPLAWALRPLVQRRLDALTH